jgi:hypothetical protein
MFLSQGGGEHVVAVLYISTDAVASTALRVARERLRIP